MAIGQNANTPQSTEQKKWQFRNDLSWSTARFGGIGHAFKTGVNYIHEPHLLASANNGTNGYTYTHLTNDINGPLSLITLNGGSAEANMPLNLFSAYFQDDWRLTDRLTLNVGLRYDLVTGYQIDQSRNPNYTKTVNAARAGLLDGVIGLENFAEEPREDYDNIQPRLGAAYDVRGDGKDVIRGGWGVYYDVSYTNSSVLFPALDATGIGFGQIFNVTDQAGIRNPDGSFYRIDQPISNIASQNLADPNVLPLIGQFLDPRVEQPFTKQASIGWSHELMSSTVLTVDYVRIDGRDLNIRPRLNTVVQPSGMRRLAFLGLLPNAATTRPAVSRGESTYQGLITGVKRRFSNGFDFTATYTLATAKSTIGTAADELSIDNIQDSTNPFDAPVQNGPNRRTDARHKGTITAVVQLPLGITAAPLFIFRSALPVYITEGVDTNLDGQLNDITARAYAFDGVGNAAEGHRRLRNGELRPRREEHAVQPARDEGVRPRPRDAARSDRRGLQPVQREEPRRLPPDQRPEPPHRRRSAERRSSCSRRRMPATSSRANSWSARSASASRSERVNRFHMYISIVRSSSPMV